MNYMHAPGPGDRHDTQGDVNAERDTRHEAAMEALKESSRSVDAWISDEGMTNAALNLLSMLMCRGLPCSDTSERTDSYRDTLEAAIKSVSDDFESWAVMPQRFSGISPMQWYIAQVAEDQAAELSND